MRRFYLLIPFIFFGVQSKVEKKVDYTQIKKNDSMVFKIETDTMLLSYVSEKLVEEVKEIEVLENRKKELKRQLNSLKRQQKLINQAKEDLEKFNNRGL